MDKGLERFLERCEPAEIDRTLIDTLMEEMKAAVPEIEQKIRERQRWAAEYRRRPNILFAPA